MTTTLLPAPSVTGLVGPVGAEDYLAFERAASEKHEFYDGYLQPMSGASFDHNRIADNTLRLLGNQLLDAPCEAVGSNLRIWIPARSAYVYPDVLVVCGSPAFVPDQYLDTISNPTLLVEVLSPSTRSHDRGDKFALYRALPSVREYLLLDSVRVQAELFSREAARPDHWRIVETTDPAAVLALTSIACTLPLREVYRRVSFLAARM